MTCTMHFLLRKPSRAHPSNFLRTTGHPTLFHTDDDLFSRRLINTNYTWVGLSRHTHSGHVYSHLTNGSCPQCACVHNISYSITDLLSVYSSWSHHLEEVLHISSNYTDVIRGERELLEQIAVRAKLIYIYTHRHSIPTYIQHYYSLYMCCVCTWAI